MPSNITDNDIVYIAETAFNHEGDKEYLLRLIKESAETGISHIKFQILLNYDDFVSDKSESYDLIKSWCFSKSEWNEILDYAESLDLRLFLMPLDCASVEFCKRQSVDFIEIHSVSFNDRELIEKIQILPSYIKIVLGSGGRTKTEIARFLVDFDGYSSVIMHGYQAFPTALEEVKLARIKYIESSFPGVHIGYADHSSPSLPESVYSSVYAYHLGARIFEKHVSLNENRTDSQSAFLPKQLSEYVNEMNRFFSIIDRSEEDSFSFSDSEYAYRERQKKVVAKIDIKRGDIFGLDNIALKVHTDPGFSNLEDFLGKVSNRCFSSGDTINL